MLLLKQSHRSSLPDAPAEATVSHEATHLTAEATHSCFFWSVCFVAALWPAWSRLKRIHCLCVWLVNVGYTWLQWSHSAPWTRFSRRAFSMQLPPLEPIIKALAFPWQEATEVLSQISPQRYRLKLCWPLKRLFVWVRWDFAVRPGCISKPWAHWCQRQQQKVTWLTAFCPLTKISILRQQVELSSRGLIPLAIVLTFFLGPSATAGLMKTIEASELKQVLQPCSCSTSPELPKHWQKYSVSRWSGGTTNSHCVCLVTKLTLGTSLWLYGTQCQAAADSDADLQ